MGSVAYGRLLTAPYSAYYNYRTTSPDSDLDRIASKPVLFKVAVRQSWEVIERFREQHLSALITLRYPVSPCHQALALVLLLAVNASTAFAQDEPAFSYEAYCDALGRFTSDQAAQALVQRPAHLHRVYEDAARGNARAKELIRQLEQVFRDFGTWVAEETTQPRCLPLPEVTPGCLPRLGFLDDLLGHSPEAARLRELDFHFAKHAGEWGPPQALRRHEGTSSGSVPRTRLLGPASGLLSPVRSLIPRDERGGGAADVSGVSGSPAALGPRSSRPSRRGSPMCINPPS